MPSKQMTKEEKADLRERFKCGRPDAPTKRRRSSVAILSHRLTTVVGAISAGEQHAAREELRRLADEATMLAGQDEIR